MAEKEKKLSRQELLAAISTAAYQNTEHLNSNKHLGQDEEGDKPYWLSCQLNHSMKVKLRDNKIFCTYTVEILNPLRLGFKHEADVNKAFSDFESFLKKGYKDVTGKSLSLKQQTDIVEETLIESARRQIRKYTTGYTIGSIESEEEKYKKETEDLLKRAVDKLKDMRIYKKTTK